MSEQARDSNGRFASGGHGAEAGARTAQRYPVTVHSQQSLATRTGKLLADGAPTSISAQE
jgi:hypothetical protein